MGRVSRSTRIPWLALLSVLASFMIWPGYAGAEDGPSGQFGLNEIRTSLRAEVSQLISGVDSQAHVDLFLTPIKFQGIALPGTLTIVQQNTIFSSSNLPQFKSIEVVVHSKLTELPGDVDELVRRKVSMFTKNVKLTIKKPLQGYKVPASTVQIDTSVFGDMRKRAREAATALLVLGLALIFGLAYVGHQLGKQSAVVQKSAQSLVQALESSSFNGGTSRPQVVSSSRDIPLALDRGKADGPGSSSDLLLELSDAGIAALISDAYWCERDAYAAHIWGRLPVARKQVLLGGLQFAKDYASYLANVPESAEKWEQHPYYLNPLPIWSFDNKQMASIIRLYPSVITTLSPMRLAALPFPSSELVLLREKSRLQPTANPDYSKIEVSALRLLQTGLLIRSKDESDDEKLLQMQQVAVQTMGEVVSLVWAMKIQQSELEEILRNFSAAELATAWTAPAVVLEKMGSAMPEKKLKMILAYVEKSAASRESPTYLRLHQMINERILPQVAIEEDSEKDFGLDMQRSA